MSYTQCKCVYVQQTYFIKYIIIVVKILNAPHQPTKEVGLLVFWPSTVTWLLML